MKKKRKTSSIDSFMKKRNAISRPKRKKSANRNSLTPVGSESKIAERARKRTRTTSVRVGSSYADMAKSEPKVGGQRMKKTKVGYVIA
jgi:hypothetical protein